jgi:hypothetical protein
MPDQHQEQQPDPSSEPWRAWAVGQRVVVRRHQPAGSAQPYTDVLGDLLAVPGAEIAIGKVVPPAPVRRPRRTPD